MITVKDVEHVAKLARLDLLDHEKLLYTEQLSRIIEYFSELQGLDTTDVEPMSQPLPLYNVMRDDLIQAPPGHQKLLQTAPDKEGAFIRVPRIRQ
ncbi:MAG: Asp-tRNA(Asn)/Glu-tRNA(Gln) amidotransferase subunit GatC [Candidatus Obscuribacterales bacterium]|nr:Asp-tRNA(Asn)/Glu-tRNA(Gln) amidotransferase subunit GatC [Candidatus Obscuribacterales bacterium]